jgi:hypothetical protein
MMSKWLILHNDSRFSQILREVLGRDVLAIHIDDLVNSVAVQAYIGENVNHSWALSGKVVDDFAHRIIFQEVFFSVESALYQYNCNDHGYVKFSWQAYLLSLFSCSKIVINPVTPNNLSISYYQFPRLLTLAEKAGLSIPNYEVGRGCKPGYIPVDTLWFWPDRKNHGIPIMNVERVDGEDHIIRFVRYDKSYMICWPVIPESIRVRLLKLCNQLDVYIGEACFRVKNDWVFYGLRPQIQTSGCEDAVLLEIAECVRDIGNEGII